LTKQCLYKVFLVITACLSLPYMSFSQTLLPPDQPEQDACNALPLCGGKFFTPYSYQGIGLVSDLTQTPCDGGEDNSMWLKVTVANAGQIIFKIIPLDTTDDYDFAVLNVTNVKSCSQLDPSDVVECNFNNNEPGSNALGIVGLDPSSTLTEVQGGTFGESFLAPINATAGQTYLIMINNFGNDNDPGPSHGFTIDFSESTATFQGNAPPALQSIVKQCSDSTVTIQLNGPIQCSSIATDGSQFYTTPTIPITGASGANCVSGGYTSQVVITFSGHVTPGNYVLNAQTGTSSTTLTNLCGDAMTFTSTSSTISFTVPAGVKDNYLPPDTTKCDYSTITEGALRTFDSYLWSTGQSTSTIPIVTPGLYTLQVTDSNGCIGTDSISITDSTCPQYVYLPNAFTPNGDGKNDIFRPVFAGAASTFRFAVYDRWGRLVFVTSTPGAGWDGTTGGRPQPGGTYVWECVYKLYQEPERMQRGTVMLIR
jgi:gliding motility-associated-like protein